MIVVKMSPLPLRPHRRDGGGPRVGHDSNPAHPYAGRNPDNRHNQDEKDLRRSLTWAAISLWERGTWVGDTHLPRLLQVDYMPVGSDSSSPDSRDPLCSRWAWLHICMSLSNYVSVCGDALRRHFTDSCPCRRTLIAAPFKGSNLKRINCIHHGKRSWNSRRQMPPTLFPWQQFQRRRRSDSKIKQRMCLHINLVSW